MGVHVSISGGIDLAADRAKERGCDTFQIFTRNPRVWKFGELDDGSVKAFVEKVQSYGIEPPIAHMPYLPNLASPKDDVYNKSTDALISDLKRCGQLKIPYLVTHLGSHTGSGMDRGFKRIVDGCNKALESVDNDVTILLENTAGQKNSMGSTFEDIKFIIERLKHKDRVGVCFDTCHAFAAGYDLRSEGAVDESMDKFRKIIGINLLKAVHLNDCKGELGSGRDRHEHIGMGFIGEDGFRAVLHHDALRGRPMILETPVDLRRDDAGNLSKVRELANTSLNA